MRKFRKTILSILLALFFGSILNACWYINPHLWTPDHLIMPAWIDSIYGICNKNTSLSGVLYEYRSRELWISFDFIGTDDLESSVDNVWNVVCVSACHYSFKADKRDKIGCIEIIDSDTKVLTGEVDTDGDWIKESLVTMENITWSDKQYLKYDCRSCSPVPDFSWLHSLKFSLSDYREIVRSKNAGRVLLIGFFSLIAYLIILFLWKKVK